MFISLHWPIIYLSLLLVHREGGSVNTSNRIDLPYWYTTRGRILERYWDKILKSFPPCFPLSKNGLKLVRNVKIVLIRKPQVWELSRLRPQPQWNCTFMNSASGGSLSCVNIQEEQSGTGFCTFSSSAKMKYLYTLWGREFSFVVALAAFCTNLVCNSKHCCFATAKTLNKKWPRILPNSVVFR